MSTEGEAGEKRRGEPRVPFEGAVRLRYRLFHEFLEEHAANLSSGGMFIRTIHPAEVGSEVEFEIQLEDDFPLIQGSGEVVWVRRVDEQPQAEPGIGIRFVEIDSESRLLVDKIVRERIAAGLELFDLEGHSPAAREEAAERAVVTAPADSDGSPIWELEPVDAAPADAAPGGGPPAEEPFRETLGPQIATAPAPEEAVSSPAERRPAAAPPPRAPVSIAGARSRSSPVRLIAVAVLSALIAAAAALAFYWLYVQPSIDALETRIDELAGSPGGPWRPPADEPAPRAPAVGEPAAVAAVRQSDEVIAALRGWAAAWSEKRPDDYVAYYAADFVPPDGLDRAAWEAARRARIERPEWIRVALTLVQVEFTGPDTAEVRFVQSYRSERYKDLVRKRMLMVREKGGWKIARERATN